MSTSLSERAKIISGRTLNTCELEKLKVSTDRIQFLSLVSRRWKSSRLIHETVSHLDTFCYRDHFCFGAITITITDLHGIFGAAIKTVAKRSVTVARWNCSWIARSTIVSERNTWKRGLILARVAGPTLSIARMAPSKRKNGDTVLRYSSRATREHGEIREQLCYL